jgi:hypothetical protein
MGVLNGFEIGRRGSDYLIHFNIEGGETIELVTTFEQLDLIAEEIDRYLNSDEERALAADRSEREAET